VETLSPSISGVAVEADGEHVAAEVGDAVVDGAANLGHEGQHAPQDLAQGCQVVLRNPHRQVQQVIAEQGLLVEYRLDGAGLKVRGCICAEGGDHTDQLLVAKGRDDTRAAARLLAFAHGVSKRAIQGHRQRDFAKGRHERQESV
jgi:hypothetical protein